MELSTHHFPFWAYQWGLSASSGNTCLSSLSVSPWICSGLEYLCTLQVLVGSVLAWRWSYQWLFIERDKVEQGSERDWSQSSYNHLVTSLYLFLTSFSICSWKEAHDAWLSECQEHLCKVLRDEPKGPERLLLFTWSNNTSSDGQKVTDPRVFLIEKRFLYLKKVFVFLYLSVNVVPWNPLQWQHLNIHLNNKQISLSIMHVAAKDLMFLIFCELLSLFSFLHKFQYTCRILSVFFPVFR